MLLASPSCVWCPPSVCLVVTLNGGSGVWLCCPPLPRVVPVLFTVFPVFELDLAPRIAPVPLCVAFPRVVLPAFSLCCCVAVLLCGEQEGGVCDVCGLIVNVVFLFFSLLRLCLLSQYCWFSGVSL